MIRNLLAGIGFVTVAMAGAAGVYATRWNGSDDHPVRLAVSTAGLDLTSPYGRRLLQRRVDAAIDRVCDSPGSSFALDRYGDRDCRRQARAGADPQIARAIDRAWDRQREDYDDAPRDYRPAPAYDAPDDYGPAPDYDAPPVDYVQPIDESMRDEDRVVPRPAPHRVRKTQTVVVRTALKPRISWVRTKRGLVKKTVSRRLVRKTVKTCDY